MRNHFQSADVGALEVVTASPAVLSGVAAENVVVATTGHIQFFDAAATGDVTLGTTRPVWEIQLDATLNMAEATAPIKFSTGITIAVTSDHWNNTAAGAGFDIMVTYD